MQLVKFVILGAFIVASILFNGFLLGPFSIRIYTTVAVIGFLVIAGYKFPNQRIVYIYVLFVVLYLVALLFNNEFLEIDFLKYFIGRYFVCLTVIYCFYNLVQGEREINFIFIVLLFLGLLNGIVSFLQFSDSSVGFVVTKFLRSSQDAQEVLDSLDPDLLGLNTGTFGVFENIVKNGYQSSVFAIMSIFFVENSKSVVAKIVFVIISFFLLYAVFLTQQRLVFLLSLLFYIIYFVRSRSSILVLVFGLAILLVAYSLSNIAFDRGSLGRLENLQDQDRLLIYSLGIDFILGHLMWGGQLAFGKEMIAQGFSVVSAHNFILNSFIYSGIFGGVTIILVFFKMLMRAFSSLFYNLGQHLRRSDFFIAGALAVYLLNSLTHNSSLVTGDEHIWILFIMLIKSLEFSQNKKNENTLCH